ncbi:hypothetical protein LTR56_008128 [Elasticomyces elasticus]|nr:hypothetical protein LTR56_008128 [Elasticomyces elasticus]KAK3662880.1 hypothetical protein LTR22_006283 [Elasticomyces elasticus]KAK4930075.1 hypothetical protein LTR49_003403 [Elasticomyces elasticus]KAK5763543.1 hypothetical protein LTS12_006314 [Elasticomyces elasticus]
MTSFSSLLSSLGDKAQAPASRKGPTPINTAQPRSNGVSDRFKLTPTNAVAGVKRRSTEPEVAPKAKSIKTEQNGLPSRPAAAPSNRFQLTNPTLSRPTSSTTPRPSSTSQNPARPIARLTARPGASQPPTPPNTADGIPKKKGFASILEKAKAAQAAAASSHTGGIKHKAVEKLTKKERMRMREEAMAQQKASRKAPRPGERSRSGTPNTAATNGGPSAPRRPPPAMETAYKGTMKKAAPEAISYNGTMKAAGSVPKPTPKKGLPQDKYGGYASWSDLDDAEEEEDDEGGGGEDFDSEDDMEGGFDDLEAEENEALRAAKREDLAALAEEERLRREKVERKRKLEALSKSAAARKKF